MTEQETMGGQVGDGLVVGGVRGGGAGVRRRPALPTGAQPDAPADGLNGAGAGGAELDLPFARGAHTAQDDRRRRAEAGAERA